MGPCQQTSDSGQWILLKLRRENQPLAVSRMTVFLAREDFAQASVVAIPPRAEANVRESQQQTTISPMAPVGISVAGRAQNRLGMISRLLVSWAPIGRITADLPNWARSALATPAFCRLCWRISKPHSLRVGNFDASKQTSLPYSAFASQSTL